MSDISIGGSGSFRTVAVSAIDAPAADRITEFYGEWHPEGTVVLLAIRPGLAGDTQSAIRVAQEIEIASLVAQQTGGIQGITTFACLVGDMAAPGILLSMGATYRWCVRHAHFSGAGMLPSDLEFCRIYTRQRLTEHAGRTLASGCRINSEAAEHFGLVDLVCPSWQQMKDLIHNEAEYGFWN